MMPSGKSPATSFSIRPADPDRDYDRIAALIHADDPHSPVTASSLREDDAAAPAGSIRRWVVAEEETGDVVGFSHLIHPAWTPPGDFRLQLLVDRSHRSRGAGSRLYEDVLAFLNDRRAGRVRATIRDDCPECRHFAERRGFAVFRHVFESVLELSTFDEGPFAGSIERAEAADIRFVTLAELGDTDGARRRFYELRRALAYDAPNFRGVFPPYEEFHRGWFEQAVYHPAGGIVAVSGEEWIGLAMVGYVEERREAFNAFTGVLEPYRGRGIALALKLLANRYAAGRGARTISTGNDSDNAPMLAINRKLGYVPLTGTYGLELRLA